tara:strand:+ start:135 stop:857 length:723 start_codon:yes stop_codon:yes gene_type:complete
MNLHLVIGTPMYGGMCTSEYTQSLLNLSESANKSDVKLTTIFLGNESLIQRGRNTVAHHFMNLPDATHLLFIDADIKFRTEDIVRMIQADKSLIIGPVGLKGYNWDEIRQAAINGEDDIGRTGGVFNINKLPGIDMVDENTPFEIEHGGNAFMMIRRDVFETLKPHTPIYTNGGRSLPDGVEIYDYFRVEINKDTNHLLSEDYFLCHSYRQLGGKVWCAPWVETGHFGSHLFNGKYSRNN